MGKWDRKRDARAKRSDSGRKLMDYYYGDALRWSYGFDNPNKAAALFACGLAVAWMLWALAWRVPGRFMRVLALGLAAGGVLATAFFLFKTYSRGGAVAAGCAVVYLVARSAGGNKRSPRRIAIGRLGGDVFLLGAVVALFAGTGLAGRAWQPMKTSDASIENRLVLWQSALQMAADNPRGFGLGKSGEAYMNWYQPAEMTTGYRTMVNSYLTALVEWGWPTFAVAGLMAAFAWGWANPGSVGNWSFDVAGGLRAVILAFAVAGVFSTTMEEWTLWICPVVCGVVLLGWAVAERCPARMAWRSLAVGTTVGMILLAVGKFWSWRDAERRKFGTWSFPGIVRVGPKSGETGAWGGILDPVVLGRTPGRLLRSLAGEMSAELIVSAPASERYRGVIVAGQAVAGPVPSAGKVLVLLAPAVIPEEKARQLLAAAPHTVIFVPGIDEDGRSEFWTTLAASHPQVEVVPVEGVGVQLDWGWDRIIEKMRTL